MPEFISKSLALKFLSDVVLEPAICAKTSCPLKLKAGETSYSRLI
jgi:hypothetical protein